MGLAHLTLLNQHSRRYISDEDIGALSVGRARYRRIASVLAIAKIEVASIL